MKNILSKKTMTLTSACALMLSISTASVKGESLGDWNDFRLKPLMRTVNNGFDYAIDATKEFKRELNNFVAPFVAEEENLHRAHYLATIATDIANAVEDFVEDCIASGRRFVRNVSQKCTRLKRAITRAVRNCIDRLRS